MKTILIATDFSDHAKVAGQYAILLAQQLDADLVCVHASIMSEAKPDAFEIAHNKLEDFRTHLQERMGQKRHWLELLADQASKQGVKSQHHLVDGSPANAICAAAEEVSADLVIVGSHGHTGFKRILLGSVAEKVVRLCKSSVLVARSPIVSQEGLKRILVATDFSDSAGAALDQAGVLAAQDAAIDILHCWHVSGLAEGPIDPIVGPAPVYSTMAEHVVADAERRSKDLVSRASQAQRKVQFHLFQGRATAGVQTFIEEQEPGYDLVAVGTHGRTGLSRLLLGSVAEVTVRYSPCSVLVARQ
ncbi:MAG: universal stress protein [Proteobacteria bacterium]|nr:universal stress protein [Pseudomonadota bacterium]